MTIRYCLKEMNREYMFKIPEITKRINLCTLQELIKIEKYNYVMLLER